VSPPPTRARSGWILPTTVGTTLVLVFLALGVFVRHEPSGLDAVIGEAFRGQWRQPAGDVAWVVSAVLGPVLPVLFGCVVLYFTVRAWRSGQRQQANFLLRLLAVLALCRCTSFVFKPTFVRDRPRDYPDLSYPSGHVVSVASTVFAGAVLCAWLARRLLRRIIVLGVVAVALSAASRLVLGVHWLTDTVGSVLAVTGVGLVACAALRLLPARPHRLSASSGAA
jgi:membrane-associated phospholipid phosphatase